MIKKKLVSDCITNKQPKGQFDCVMEFIASKMNCSMNFTNEFYPANLNLCQSKEDLKRYIDIKIDIYKAQCSQKEFQIMYYLEHPRYFCIFFEFLVISEVQICLLKNSHMIWQKFEFFFKANFYS